MKKDGLKINGNLIVLVIALLAVIRFRPTGILGWYMHSKAKRFVDTRILKKPPVEVFEAVELQKHGGKEA